MVKTGYSVIVPVHNEGKILVGQVEKLNTFLKRQGRPFQIVLGENGSTDNTLELGKALQRKHPSIVKIVATPKRGVGNGIRVAAMGAKFDHLIEMPIDLTADLQFIPESAMLLDTYDYVIGSKQLGNQTRHKWLEFLSKGYCVLTNILLGLKYSDYSVGTKAYRKQAIAQRLQQIDGGSFYQTDFIYHANKKKLKIIEIPIDSWDKRKGQFDFKWEVIYRFKMLFKLWKSTLQ